MWDPKLTGNNMSILEVTDRNSGSNNTTGDKQEEDNINNHPTTAAIEKKNCETSHGQDSGYLSGPLTLTSDIEIDEQITSSCGAPSIGQLPLNSKTQQQQQQVSNKIQETDKIDYTDSGAIDDFNSDDKELHEMKLDSLNQQQQQQQHHHRKEQTVDDDNNKMYIDSGVDVGLSEWFCNMNLTTNPTQPINNLGAINSEFFDDIAEQKANAKNLSNISKKLEETPLWELCYQQDEESGDTQLHFAIIGGSDYVQIIFAIIRLAPHPCFLDIRNDICQTPLHLAVLTNQPAAVRRLLIAGAKATIRDRNGNTPLHLACQNGDMDCVKALTKSITFTELQEAYKYLNRTTQQQIHPLTNFSPDLEQRNYFGEHCIHKAIQCNNIDMVRYLVSCGADINAREGRCGYTPLHMAIENGNEEMVNLLLEQSKINIECRTYARLTPYQFAVLEDNDKLMLTLKKCGAELLAAPSSESDDESSESEFDEY